MTHKEKYYLTKAAIFGYEDVPEDRRKEVYGSNLERLLPFLAGGAAGAGLGYWGAGEHFKGKGMKFGTLAGLLGGGGIRLLQDYLAHKRFKKEQEDVDYFPEEYAQVREDLEEEKKQAAVLAAEEEDDEITPEELEAFRGELPSPWATGLESALWSGLGSAGLTAAFNRRVGPETAFAGGTMGTLGGLYGGFSQHAENRKIMKILQEAMEEES